MRRSTTLYIFAVVLAAGCAIGLLAAMAPELPRDRMVVVLLLAGLAATGEVLGYLLPHAARGSIAIVPYLSMVVLVPSWFAVVAALCVKAVTEAVARVPGHKLVFNVAQLVITLSVAILLFAALGGVSLLTIQPPSLIHVSSVAGGQAILAFATAYFINSLLVVGAIALETQKSLFEVWGTIKRTSMGLDLLVSAPIFVFAWVYAAFGPIAAATLWVPFLGFRHAQKTNIELAQTNQELLELMVKSLEARDPYTSGHSRRVRQFSIIIARACGLPQKEIDHVARAALLHDVGKIHEKYAPILSKQDKLSPEEWATMQEHPADGANLVATMTRLRDVVAPIRHHHENWDGTGYPDGLAGESIPLSSRIIRFADTIDAMTTERPYRLPLTELQVKAEVIRCRATQFDPLIADRLLSSALWPTLFASPSIGEKTRAPFIVLGGRRKAAAGA